jgi:hypothetical protein
MLYHRMADAYGVIERKIMKRIPILLALIVLSPSLACDSTKSYPLKFMCEPGGDACPTGTECPALPLGGDTCGELPGLFGHPVTPVTEGRPVGCTVFLPYGNPYYGDSQQACTCTAAVSSPSSPGPRWLCPV